MARTAEVLKPKADILKEIRLYCDKIEKLQTQQGLDAEIRNDLENGYVIRLEKNVRRMKKHQS